jgi:uncharacterized protein GlcG (DUF336 family)
MKRKLRPQAQYHPFRCVGELLESRQLLTASPLAVEAMDIGRLNEAAAEIAANETDQFAADVDRSVDLHHSLLVHHGQPTAPGVDAFFASATQQPADTPRAALAEANHQRVPRAPLPHPASAAPSCPVSTGELTACEVEILLKRAAAASATNDAIIAVVDRGGRVLGVRVEKDVPIAASDTDTLVFAIDGALAKARTAAFFANNSAPLTSRLIRFISQSTITQREVESNPNSLDAHTRGPGFVAPIGLGGHFPPEIAHTPLVDLFAIEHTNRDSIIHPGPDHIKGTMDDIVLPGRFNEAELADKLTPPESYGFVSGRMPDAQARGIATLPGGVPLFKKNAMDKSVVVGGIGVFFPGSSGYATFEQGFRSNMDPLSGEPLPQRLRQTEKERTNSDLTLEAELIAFAAAGGSEGASFPVNKIVDSSGGAVPDLPGFDLPFGRLTLVGIELEVFGPHPRGLKTLKSIDLTEEDRAVRGACKLKDGCLGGGDSGSHLAGFDAVITDNDLDPTNDGVSMGVDFVRDGEAVPEGWLVGPKASSVDPISESDVERIIGNAIHEADRVRAAIRLPFGSRTSMVFSVTDTTGNILGLFRMPDATVFSIDVAVAKARNTAYYADATAIQLEDRVDRRDPDGLSCPLTGTPDLVPAGAAFSNRTFRFLADPRYPDGVDGTCPGPFSVLLDPGTHPETAENDLSGPVPYDAHTSVLGFDAFNPGTNFRDPDEVANQNGIVFFPGSTPIYKDDKLIGGLGVSGDGVDQDDVVTFSAGDGFLPPDAALRADEVFVRGVRLPFIKFLRNPRG